MALKLTAESFLAGIRQSGLIAGEGLDAVMADLRRRGTDVSDAGVLADEMIRRGLITRWQSEKLLQGKFKGFLLGRYRLRELLGRGEMSSIYLAEHSMMKRCCAIKVLPAHKVKDTSYLGRFQREAQAVAALDHPNIVRAFDVDVVVDGGHEIHFLVMEYVDGKDLEKTLESRGKFSVVDAVDVVRQAAEGLAHAHEAGLIHRDIKPGNLLIDSKGTVKVLDLGLARFFRETEGESLTIKHDEKVLGTADYLAPEQAVDSHAVDERADIYSLGCTLYFVLAGRPPFTEGTLVQRLLAHQTKPPTPIRTLRPEVPESLAAIIDRMMQKRREDRFQKAAEVAESLSAWLVEFGDNAWRESHAAIVARILGMAALSRPVAPLTPTPASAKADIARVEPTAPAATETRTVREEILPLRKTSTTGTAERPRREPAAPAEKPAKVSSAARVVAASPATVAAAVRSPVRLQPRPRVTSTGQIDFVHWAMKNAALMAALFATILILIGSLAMSDGQPRDVPVPTDTPTLQAERVSDS